MGRRLKTIAREINESIPGFTAEITDGYCNTDRKIAGTRLRWEGKGRTGNKLVVRNADGHVVLRHNAAETYRQNSEVEEWLAKLKDTIDQNGPELRTFCPHCRKKLVSKIADKPFGHCPKCNSSFLLTEGHY